MRSVDEERFVQPCWIPPDHLSNCIFKRGNNIDSATIAILIQD